MDIKGVLSKNLGISKLTGPSLREAIVHHYDRLPDDDKRRINREIAHDVMKAVRAAGGKKKYEDTIYIQEEIRSTYQRYSAISMKISHW